MSRSTLVAACLLLLVACFYGCGKDKGPIVAKVGDYEITVREFKDFMGGHDLPFQYENPQAEFDKKRAFVDSIVNVRLLIQAAYKTDLPDSDELERLVNSGRDRFLLEALYQTIIGDKLKVSAAELRDFYNRLQYQLHAYHILLPTEDSAYAVLERLKQGEDFQELAYECSIDPSAKRDRGDLGFFTYGSMVDEFENVVFRMDVGEISPPVKTPYGYHIIKLVERRENETRQDFLSMRPKIHRQLEAEKRAALSSEYFGKMMKKYQVVIDTAVVNYIMHKREDLYPPNLLSSMPKSDFDDDQLDRDERELVLATWKGGQMTLIKYLVDIREALPLDLRPDLDDLDSLARVVFELNKQQILVTEAEETGIADSDIFKEKMHLFREYGMASMLRFDSIQALPDPTEEEIRQYYDDHLDDYVNPATVHVFEIQLNDELAARNLARKIKSLADFKAKAAELTERTGMRAKQGDLGYIESTYYPEIFKVAWTTKLGTVGGPVPVRGKYSIIWPIDRKEESYRDFLDMKDHISRVMVKEAKNDVYQKWLADQKAKTKIEIFENVIWDTIDRNTYRLSDVDSTKKS